MIASKKQLPLLALLLVLITGGQAEAAGSLKDVKKVAVPAFVPPSATVNKVVLKPSTLTSSVLNPVSLDVTTIIPEGINPTSIHYRTYGPFCHVTGNLLYAIAPTSCKTEASISAGPFSTVAISDPVVVYFGQSQQPLNIYLETSSALAVTKGTSVTLFANGGSGSGGIQFSVTPGDICTLSNGIVLSTCTSFKNNIGSVCSVVGNVLTATASSVCEVKATKFADSIYSPLTSEALSIKFGPGTGNQPIILPPVVIRTPVAAPVTSVKIPQPIELVISNPPSDTDLIVGETVTVTTKGGSGSGAVYYQWVLGRDCSLKNGMLIAFSPTTCLLNAIKVGDSVYKSQTSQNVSFTFRATTPTPAIYIDPSTPVIAEVNSAVTIVIGGGVTSASKWLEVSSATRDKACTLRGFVLTANTADVCTVIAHQGAVGNYFSSESTPYAITFR